jgi:hypothetical protein
LARKENNRIDCKTIFCGEELFTITPPQLFYSGVAITFQGISFNRALRGLKAGQRPLLQQGYKAGMTGLATGRPLARHSAIAFNQE